MRKKVVAAVALVALALTIEVALDRAGSDGQLRIGMTAEEADTALTQLPYPSLLPNDHPPPTPCKGLAYTFDPGNWMGDVVSFVVYLDDDERVVGWEKQTCPNGRTWRQRVENVTGFKLQTISSPPPLVWKR
jgi:hypothetical protein